MTVSEAVNAPDEGCFYDELGFVLGIDMSESGDAGADDFTAVTEGVFSVSADFSPRVVIRDYVDGDRAVPVSKRGSITVKFLCIAGDAVQERIMRCAENGVPVRCVYTDGSNMAFEGYMLISQAGDVPSEVYGRTVTAVFTVC